MSKYSEYQVGEVLTWKIYAHYLDLSHWSNCSSLEDRQVVGFGDNRFAVPVYAKDILDSPEVSRIELPNNLLVVSWDNFKNDATVIRNEDTGEPIVWLLVKQVNHKLKISTYYPNPLSSIEEIKELLFGIYERPVEYLKLSQIRGF